MKTKFEEPTRVLTIQLPQKVWEKVNLISKQRNESMSIVISMLLMKNTGTPVTVEEKHKDEPDLEETLEVLSTLQKRFPDYHINFSITL